MPLTLPANVDQAFREANAFIEAFFNPERFALGGGTALAARWDHRFSTDLDFFGEFAEFLPILDAREKEIRERLPELCPSCVPGSLSMNALAGLTFRSGKTPVSIFAYSPTGRVRGEAEAIEGSRVRAESTELILTTKLVLRMSESGQILPRDVYDLVYANRFDPAAAQLALIRLPSVQRATLAAQLRRLPDDWAVANDQILEPRLDFTPASLLDEFERLLLGSG